MHTMTKTAAAVVAALGLVAGGAAISASAHTPELSVSCTDIRLDLTNYPGEGNSFTATLDGQDLGTTPFGSEYHSPDFALDPAVAHSWHIAIDSSDGDQFDKVIEGSSSPSCIPVTPPVEPPVVVLPAEPNPHANIITACGTATPWVSNDLGEAAERLTASFVVYVDGQFREALVAEGGAVVSGTPVTFPEDSGNHVVTVRTGPAFGDALVAEVTVGSDCQPPVVVTPPTEEPTTPEVPTVPETPVTPEVPVVADEPVTPAAVVEPQADVLASTGTADTTPLYVGGAVLALMLGAGTIIAARRRARNAD